MTTAAIEAAATELDQQEHEFADRYREALLARVATMDGGEALVVLLRSLMVDQAEVLGYARAMGEAAEKLSTMRLPAGLGKLLGQ